VSNLLRLEGGKRSPVVLSSKEDGRHSVSDEVVMYRCVQGIESTRWSCPYLRVNHLS
jgi:hypothetical protein